MMDAGRMHFNRATLIALVAIAGSAVPHAGLAQLPERARATPEIVGRLARRGVPVADARVGVVLHEAGGTMPRDGCGSPSLRETNDSGAFRVRAQWRWLNTDEMTALRRGDPEMQHRFFVCMRLKNETQFRVVFQAPALRWDTLHLACDLGRVWLKPDREGRAGYCEVERSAIDGIETPERLPRQRLPDITCDTTTAVIQRLRVGPVRGQGSIEQLQRLCPSLRDTTLQPDVPIEAGRPRDAMVLTIAGTPVIVHRSGGLVEQITIRSPGLKTADSIGVGTPASRLARLPNLHVLGNVADLSPWALAYQGAECGIVYHFTQPRPPSGSTRRFIEPEELRSWPDSTRITRIVVGVCPQYLYPRKP